MKNYEDMTERVFRRVHEYEDKKARRIRTLKRTFLTVSPLCIAVIAAAAVHMSGLSRPPAPIDDSIVSDEVVTTTVSGTASDNNGTAIITSSGTSGVSGTTDIQQPVSDTSVTADNTVAASTEKSRTEHSAEAAAGTDEAHEAAASQTAVTTTKTSKATTAVTSVQTETESAAPVNTPEGNSNSAIEDRMYTATVNGALYLQITSFNGKADLFTPDEMIGHGWDYQDDHYCDNTEIYTTKESKYILIARYEGGTEIVLRRANDLIVGSDEYFITAWNSAAYTVNEDNFIGTVSDYERIYTAYDSEVSDPNVILEPGCRLYTTDEDGDILIAVHTNGNAVILHIA